MAGTIEFNSDFYSSSFIIHNNIKYVKNNIGDIMIENYEIKNINGEDVLYLYFNLDSEFSNFKNQKKKIEDTIKKFIEDNKIAFKGTLVSLVVGGMIIGNVIINKPNTKEIQTFNDPIQITETLSNDKVEESNIDTNIQEEIVEEEKVDELIQKEKEEVKPEIKQESIKKENTVKEEIKQQEPKIEKKEETKNQESNIEQKEQPKVEEIKQQEEQKTEVKEEVKQIEEEKEVDNNIYITVKRSNGSTLKIELEEYLVGVVGAEMPAAFNLEALKAQAVVARTYALKAMKTKGYVTDTSSTQNYKDNQQLKNMWGSSYNTYYNKVKNAVDSTKGAYLTYKGEYIDAVYHSTSNGRTEDSINVWGNYYPYLVSVDSPYDNTNPSFLKTESFTYSEISSKLNLEINSDTEFNIISKTTGNRVKIIKINDKEYTGVDIRNKLGLRSTDFEIEKTENSINIITKGYGHGVGMSQYGANGMAKNGYSYINILKHYYTNVVINHL